MLRREITAQGRSRAFIDGALATSASLRELSSVLVDLHGQHEHQLLLDPSAHLDLLDEFAGIESERFAVAAAFVEWQKTRDEGESPGRRAERKRRRAQNSWRFSSPRSTASRRSRRGR